MDAAELRNFSIEELQSRIRQWRDELFRSKFKSESSEAKDTSVFKKLRRDIARANTVLTAKQGTGAIGASAPVAKAAASVEDKVATPKKESTKGKKKTSRKSEKAEGVTSNE